MKIKRDSLQLMVKCTARILLSETAKNIDSYNEKYLKLLVKKDNFFTEFQKESYETFELNYTRINDWFHANFKAYDYDVLENTSIKELEEMANELTVISQLNACIRSYISINLTD